MESKNSTSLDLNSVQISKDHEYKRKKKKKKMRKRNNEQQDIFCSQI